MQTNSTDYITSSNKVGRGNKGTKLTKHTKHEDKKTCKYIISVKPVNSAKTGRLQI